MSDSPDNNDNKGDKTQPDTSKTGNHGPAGIGSEPTPQQKAANAALPAIWSPGLNPDEAVEPAGLGPADDSPHGGTQAGASSDMDGDEPWAEPWDQPWRDEVAAEPSPSRVSRFPMLIVTLALAAAFGSFAGVLAGKNYPRNEAAASIPAEQPVVRASAAETAVLLQAIKSQRLELTALKASLESATRGSGNQLAKISDRLDRIEHAEADPAKLAQLADALDRLNKRVAAADTTGSIGPPQGAAPKLKERVLDGWIVQDVQDGHALIASRNGGEFDIAVGSVLPGLGRVQDIQRRDGHWNVVTDRGVITSMR